ncbi:MAG: hypothetical protein JWO91_613 [Acidobacteriaceae bacterium]|nr:hypothetical protein [Acidobacteriaceae bacterium]
MGGGAPQRRSAFHDPCHTSFFLVVGRPFLQKTGRLKVLRMGNERETKQMVRKTVESARPTPATCDEYGQPLGRLRLDMSGLCLAS